MAHKCLARKDESIISEGRGQEQVIRPWNVNLKTPTKKEEAVVTNT